MDQATSDPFRMAFSGRFISVLRWEQLDDFWDVLSQDTGESWYIYAVGEPPPQQPASGEMLKVFILEIDQLLRREHDEDYCGVVYADSLESPAFVKIFDPNNLGVSCGFSDNPPLPGWILSRLKPVDLQSAVPPPGNRRRWWRRLIGG